MPWVHPSMGGWQVILLLQEGSLLIQPTVQVHGNRHGRNLGVARCKSAPLDVHPPSPSPHAVGSQPTIPSAPGERAGCAQGRRLSSLELQVVLELQQPPGFPQAGPSPTSRHREEAALQCSGTHLQGSNASCHTTHHSCVGPDFLQDLWETALQEATTWVRMSKKW